MLLEGARLMAVGMFTVFAFLTLLVALMKASAAFFEAHAHRFPEAPETAGPSPRQDDGEVALALVLAHLERKAARKASGAGRKV